MLKNKKIGRKLALSFIFVTIVCSMSGIVGFLAVANTEAEYSSALVNYGFGQGEVGLFNTGFKDNSATLRDIFYTTDVKDRNSYMNQLETSNDQVNTWFKNMKGSMTGKKEISLYNDISENLEKYASLRSQIVDLVKSGSMDDAQNILSKQATPLANKIFTDTSALVSEKTESGRQLSASLAVQSAVAKGIILSAILLAVLLSVVITLKMSRGIRKPLKEMADAADKLAAGDLNFTIQTKSNDEIGQLGAAFEKSSAAIREYIADIKRMLCEMEHGNLTVGTDLEYIGGYMEIKESFYSILLSLNQTLGQIIQAAEQVSGGAGQVSQGAQSLAQGAAAQASSVEELTATIAEISENVRSNAEQAAGVSGNVNTVLEEIELSNRYMDEMVASMHSISESSSQIGKIIKTIEDIAFQTNILALNAAVEAARAGTAGKGFSVVADEVRNLASKSARAAKDTTAYITASMEQVEHGTRIADKTAKSLLRVVESAKEVTGTIEKISSATNQQSRAIAQVTVGVEQISDVVQTNSATAQESAAESEELSAQAQSLKKLANQFTLKSMAADKLTFECSN
ncbi:HAMP domain-containing methyl-accepting chemotaxis protein [Caproiciproducens faecalis]|uniref:MCP four helix bundle domain-containing protein n=1 Tax=Caproiciproducens faecalis TaxID=2820301 RepID=A0ABS7DJH4_9FIRM|nr:methyl-accepting chemotaxis protein [Caproiciproducens faecalis]MBW7571432.1 MCP four helix bundle domain-containing protein [Caproiciproducens faecalis]